MHRAYMDSSAANSSEIELQVPDIGDAPEIELLHWHVKSGDQVHTGQELCELITEKAAFPLEAPQDGQILQIFKESGSLVKVGESLIRLKIS